MESNADWDDIADIDKYFKDGDTDTRSQTPSSSMGSSEFEHEDDGSWKFSYPSILDRFLKLPFMPFWNTNLLVLSLIQILIVTYSFVFDPESDFNFQIWLEGIDLLIAIDIVVITIYKNTDRLLYTHTFTPPSNVLIFLDFLSVIPLKYMSSILFNTRFMKNKYGLNLICMFRLGRLATHFVTRRKYVGQTGLKWMIIEFLVFLMLTGFVIAIILYYLACDTPICAGNWSIVVRNNLPYTISTPFDWFKLSLIQAYKIITANGKSSKIDVSFLECIIEIILHMFFLFWIHGYYLSSIIIANMQRQWDKQKYFNELETFWKGVRYGDGVPDDVLDKTWAYFEKMWIVHKGTKGITGIPKIPPALRKQVMLDFSIAAFFHSHIFRSAELPFLRFLSNFIYQHVACPNAYLYKTGEIKNKMFYIVSGTVQILSEEDQSTPIMSLSSGTSIGEISLFLTYESNYSVRCVDHCEILILHRRDLVKSIEKYGFHYEVARKKAQEMLENAKRLNKFSQSIAIPEMEFSRGVLTLRWIKYTINRFLHKHVQTKHTFENRVTETENYEKMYFTAKYLDKLALSGKITLVSDTVFLKSTCPCILRPESVIISLWRKFIIVMVVLVVIIIPYQATFINKVSQWYNPFIYIVTAIWMFDIYVNASTAFTTRECLVTEIKDIFNLRLTHTLLLVDILATIPFELLILSLADNPSQKLIIMFQFNRILKCHIIHSTFERLVSDSLNFGREIQFFQYIVYTLFFIYIWTVYMFALYHKFLPANSIGEREDTGKFNFFLYTFVVSQLLTRCGLRDGLDDAMNETIFTLILIVFSCVYQIILLSFIASNRCLELMPYRKQSLLNSVIQKNCKQYRVNKLTMNRMFNYMNTNWYYNQSMYLRRDKPILPFDNEVTTEVRLHYVGDLMTNFFVFQGFPKTLQEDILCKFKRFLIPQYEVIIYSREIVEQLIFILKGYCEVIASSIRQTNRILPPGSDIGTCEFFLQIPSMHTVVAQTACSLFIINRADLMTLLTQYPEELENLQSAIEYIQREILPNFIRYESLPYDIYQRCQLVKPQSIYNFKFFPRSKEKIAFQSVRNKYTAGTLLHVLLFNKSIAPDGNFLFYWELSRCILAIVSLFVFVLPWINNQPTLSFWGVVMMILDFMGVVNIYVQMHVSYYNDKGILVTHPLCTAMYYLSHHFLIDFLGCFKFEIFIDYVYNAENYLFQLCKLMRLLQFSRVFAFIRVHAPELEISKMRYQLMLHIIVVLLFGFITASLFITTICAFDDDIEASENFTAGVRCIEKSYMTVNFYMKPISRYRTFLYSVEHIVNIASETGNQGFQFQSLWQAVYANIVALIGYFSLLKIISRALSYTTMEDLNWTKFKEQVKILQIFMNNKRVSVKLRKNILKYFELLWDRYSGANIYQSMNKFNPMLIQDVLYEIYGPVFKESSIFSEADDSFIRQILANMRLEFVAKGYEIIRINDINEKLFVLISGTAKVIGAANTDFGELSPGSIFGNLQDISCVREPITVVTIGHVELLTISGLKFHKILSKFTTFKNKFQIQTILYFDFLPNVLIGRANNEQISMPSGENTETFFKKKRKKKAIGGFILHPDGQFLTNWRVAFLFVCFLTYWLNIYILATSAKTLYFTIMELTFDLFFVFHIVVVFLSAYEDQYGFIVIDKHKIAHRYVHRKEFYIDCIIALPTDTFNVLFFPHHYIGFWSGINKCLALYYVLKETSNTTLSLQTNILRSAIFNLIVKLVLLSHAFVGLKMVFSCYGDQPSTSGATVCWNDESSTSFERLKTYVYHYYAIVLILSQRSTYMYYANSCHMIIIYIIIICFCHVMRIMCVSMFFSGLYMTDAWKNKYDRCIIKTNNLLETSDLRKQLREFVLLYISKIWSNTNGIQYPTLLEKGPYVIKEQLLCTLYGEFIENCPIFSKCHKDFLRQLTARLRVTAYFPGDYIGYEGDVDETMYIVYEGVVNVLIESDLDEPVIRRQCFPGMVFARKAGLQSKQANLFTYRAFNTSIILSLVYSDWKILLLFFPASADQIQKTFKKL